MAIPAPSNQRDAWLSSGDISTPGAAWPVGIATEDQPYIEGTSNAVNGNAFFVFEAGPAMTMFTAIISANTDYIHLHRGAGLVFGAEVPAIMSSPGSGSWAVTPGEVYVLGVHQPGGGFF